MEEEVKNMIKLSYTKLNTKLKKRVAVIAAVMCAITVTSGRDYLGDRRSILGL